jgi:SAM-dependent methyltransferase
MTTASRKPAGTDQQATPAQARAQEYALTARFYDQTYATAAPADLEFYHELARDCGGAVLELGCGTGRVALTLARAGITVTGVDRSAAMLAQFRRKLAGEPAAVRERVTLVEGLLEGTDLGQRFSLVTMPFRVFQSMLSVDEQLAALGCVARQLAPGGRYVFDAFNPNLAYIVDAMRRGPAWLPDQQWQDRASGHRFTRQMSLRFEPGPQLLSIDWRFEEFDAAGRLLDTWCEPLKLRWLYRYEAEHLLDRAVFEIVTAYGDYQKSPLDDNARELIYVCQLKA